MKGKLRSDAGKKKRKYRGTGVGAKLIDYEMKKINRRQDEAYFRFCNIMTGGCPGAW